MVCLGREKIREKKFKSLNYFFLRVFFFVFLSLSLSLLSVHHTQPFHVLQFILARYSLNKTKNGKKSFLS